MHNKVIRFPKLLDFFSNVTAMEDKIGEILGCIGNVRNGGHIKIEGIFKKLALIQKKLKLKRKLVMYHYNLVFLKDFKSLEAEMCKITTDNCLTLLKNFYSLEDRLLKFNYLSVQKIIGKLPDMRTSLLLNAFELSKCLLVDYLMLCFNNRNYSKISKDNLLKSVDIVVQIHVIDEYSFGEFADAVIFTYKSYNDRYKAECSLITDIDSLEHNCLAFFSLNQEFFVGFKHLIRDMFNIVLKQTINKISWFDGSKNPFLIHIHNLFILLRNCLKEFCCHVKEYIDNVKEALVDVRFYTILEESQSEFLRTMQSNLIENFEPSLHFLYLQTDCQKNLRKLFINFKTRINLEETVKTMLKLEECLITEIHKKKYTNFIRNLSRYNESTPLVLGNIDKYKIGLYLNNFDNLNEDDVFAIFSFDNQFLALLGYLEDLDLKYMEAKPYKKDITDYRIDLIEDYIEIVKPSQDEDANLNLLCKRIRQTRFLDLIAKSFILKGQFCNHQRNSKIQNELNNSYTKYVSKLQNIAETSLENEYCLLESSVTAKYLTNDKTVVKEDFVEITKFTDVYLKFRYYLKLVSLDSSIHINEYESMPAGLYRNLKEKNKKLARDIDREMTFFKTLISN